MEPAVIVAIGVAIAPALAAAVWGFFKWLLARTVKHEDDAKVKAESRQDKQERELLELTKQVSRTEHDADLRAQDARTQLTQLSGMLGELKGSLAGLRASFEEGREKQAEFYRNELKKTEQQFRQELSRAVHPDLPERVSTLEARFPKRKG
jgi:chromosome segregation ATPase